MIMNRWIRGGISGILVVLTYMLLSTFITISAWTIPSFLTATLWGFIIGAIVAFTRINMRLKFVHRFSRIFYYALLGIIIPLTWNIIVVQTPVSLVPLTLFEGFLVGVLIAIIAYIIPFLRVYTI